MSELSQRDAEAFALLSQERTFRSESIDLVPSDNHPSPAVREAQTYPLFYSENDRKNYYYPGSEGVAEVERLAERRALELFPGSEWVNVKPTDGTRANEAVYRAFLDEGDTILSLGLADGGHLSHGLKANYSGQLYRPVHYGVTEEGQLDYDEILRLAKEHQPKMIIAGGSSCPFIFDFERFGDIAKEVGAHLHADISHFGGLVAAGLHPTPFPHADTCITTLQKTLRGAKGAIAFCRESDWKKLNRAVFPGTLAHATGADLLAKAVCLGEALTDEFKAYAKQVTVNAKALAAAMSSRGYDLVTGGTETHLMVVDLRSRDITGKDAENRLRAAGLLANKQLVPNDPQKPTVGSGIRLGTTCPTTRGMKEAEMEAIAGLIDRLVGGEDPEGVKKDVLALAGAHPIP